jgi:hypothetical protein
MRAHAVGAEAGRRGGNTFKEQRSMGGAPLRSNQAIKINSRFVLYLF